MSEDTALESLLGPMANLGIQDQKLPPPKPFATKKFTVNGQIEPQHYSYLYYVDVSKTNQELLEKFELPSNYVMLHAPRGYGKSTRAIALRESLNKLGFTCLYSTLQSVPVNHDDAKQFWSEFGGHLSRLNYNEEIQFKSAADFERWLSAGFNAQAKVVLIVDEFDALYHGSKLIREDFLGVLRAIKPQCGQTSRLWGFIGIGPFSVLKLTQVTQSPFNISDSFQSPSFNEEEVTQLFREYAKDRRIAWDDRISSDIFQRTNGHAGLVCFCGKRIDESKSPIRTYEDWLNYASTTLLLVLRTDWATIRALVDNVLQNPKAIDFLSRVVLRSSQPIKQQDNNVRMLEYLAAEGILIKENETHFRIISPLIRSLLLSALAAESTLDLPQEQFPLEGETIPITTVLKTVLKLFDKTVMKSAPRQTWKGARCGGIKKDAKVPSEPCYHFELFKLISQWASRDGGLVYCEANCPTLQDEKRSDSRRRCDIIVEFYPGTDSPTKLIIELLASDSLSSVQGHIQQAKLYRTALKATQAVVIHFFVADTMPSKLESKSIPEVKVIEVWHNMDWSKCCVYDDNGAEEMVL